MAHQAQFSIPLRNLARADVEFQVKEDGIMLGTLMISRGSLVWFPANTRNGRKMDWGKFAKLMEQEATLIERR